MSRRRRSLLPRLAFIALTLALPATARSAEAPQSQSSAGPRVLLDLPPKAVEYQLGRLTNDELLLVEGRPSLNKRLDRVRHRLGLLRGPFEARNG